MIDNLSIANENKRNNNPLLSNSIIACIIGKSGFGKTNLLLNDWLNFDHLYILSKSLHQPEYQKLIKGLENNVTKRIIADLIKNKLTGDCYIKKAGEGLQENNNKIKVEYFDDSSSIPDPTQLNKIHKNLIIQGTTTIWARWAQF